MAVDPVPAVIHGAKHSADVFRQWIHDSTSGGEGISSPTGLRVRATATPSGQVRVDPGGVIIPNTYSGGAGQSYTGRNASQTLVNVPASDSTGSKSWKIIFRVQDPQFGGPSPADPLVGPYAFIECVSASASITDPHYVLADVVVPKSTATITNAMITDVREVANPLILPVIRSRPLIAIETETLTVTTEIGEWFPNAGAEQRIDIPKWATRAIIEADWLMVREPGGNAYGQCWVEYGPWDGTGQRAYSTQRFQWNTANPSDVARNVWSVSDDRYIPAAIRGTNQVFVMKARLTGSSNNAARPQLDGESGVKMRVTFLQVADRSTT